MLGGTFDPPHIGHVVVACEALWQLRLDEVRLVPAHRPPHKPGVAIAPPERRAAWLEEAVAGRPGLVVSRVELERNGPSYTADTLEAMAAAEPGVRLWFVLGADQLEGFPGWHDPERILRLARLAVVGRGGVDAAALSALADRVAPGRADLLDVPPIGVSASMIRARMAAGVPVGHLLPGPVERALVRDGLVPSPSVEPRKEPPRPRSS